MTQNSKPLDFSKIPYSDRQLIVVQPDDVVEALRNAAKANPQSNYFDWKSVASTVAGGAGAFGLYGAAAAAAFALSKEAYESWSRARASGLSILPISNSEAKTIKLPPGHPKPSTLYVADPNLLGVYYTSASFHRVVFEHKFSEAIDMLMNLGATHIEVEHVRGWSRDFSSSMEASLPGANVTANSSAKKSESSSILFTADFDNKVVPALPSDQVWYAHEPTWQNVAKGRLKFGLSEFALALNYQDDFGVNAGMKVKAEKSGLEMGGAFENHMSTTWKISGKFKSQAL